MGVDTKWLAKHFEEQEARMSDRELYEEGLLMDLEKAKNDAKLAADWDAAADRIEALTKEREQWRRAAETRAEGWKISDDARIEAEAKLAECEARLGKAVKMLKRISMQPDYRLPSPQEIARATLAELTGGKDES